MTACTSNPQIGAPQASLPATDTTGLSEFQQWKTFESRKIKPQTVYVVKHEPAPKTTSSGTERVDNPAPQIPEGTSDVPATTPEEKRKDGARLRKELLSELVQGPYLAQ